jgi:hypothetical protein
MTKSFRKFTTDDIASERVRFLNAFRNPAATSLTRILLVLRMNEWTFHRRMCGQLFGVTPATKG